MYVERFRDRLLVVPQVAILIRVSKFGIELFLCGFLLFGIYCIIYVAICVEMVVRVFVKSIQALPWYLEYVAACVCQEALIQLKGPAADATASVARGFGFSVDEPPLCMVPASVVGPLRSPIRRACSHGCLLHYA